MNKVTGYIKHFARGRGFITAENGETYVFQTEDFRGIDFSVGDKVVAYVMPRKNASELANRVISFELWSAPKLEVPSPVVVPQESIEATLQRKIETMANKILSLRESEAKLQQENSELQKQIDASAKELTVLRQRTARAERLTPQPNAKKPHQWKSPFQPE